MRQLIEQAPSVPESRQGPPALRALVRSLTRTVRWWWTKARQRSVVSTRPDGTEDAGLGSEDDVLDALQRRAGERGSDPEGLLLLARYYELQGDLESACRMAGVALRLDPTNQGAWNQMGSVQGKMGDVEGTVVACLHADVLHDPAAIGLGYLVALSAAEVLTVLVEPRAGLVLHALLLFDLCVHAAFIWRQPVHRLLLSLTLAPLIRLLSLSLPLAGLNPIYWYLMISIPLFVAAAVVVWFLGLKPAALGLGLGTRPGLQGAVAVVGVLSGAVEYHILRPEPLVDSPGWAGALGPALILVICTGFLEELIFRGLLQSVAQQVYGSWCILYVSALFAVMCVGYRSLLDVLFVFVVGLILGWVTHRSHSILGASVAHGLTNVALFVIAPFVFGS